VVAIVHGFNSHSGHYLWVAEQFVAGDLAVYALDVCGRDDPDLLAEPFRRADWVDVSRRLITFGLSRTLLGEIFSTWPNTGFHKLLFQSWPSSGCSRIP
jgi:hypothetical protein